MKVRRYFASSMRNALELVRKEQGPEVLILSNRKVDGGIEILTVDGDVDEEFIERFTAANRQRAGQRVAQKGTQNAQRNAPQNGSQEATQEATQKEIESDRPPSINTKPTAQLRAVVSTPADKAQTNVRGIKPVQNTPKNATTATLAYEEIDPDAILDKLQPQTQGQVRKTDHPGGELWTDANTVRQMQAELSNIKNLLEQQVSGLAWSEFGARHPMRARILRLLARTGITPRLGRELVADIPDNVEFRKGWGRALLLLEGRLKVLDDPILQAGGRIALCGPTGVGKTTLACKLAARYAMQHGADKVALISTDEQRLGAHQQLKAFARLLGIAVSSVPEIDQLDARIQRFADKELVLIDSPGMAPDDIRFRELLTKLESSRQGVESYLVLSAATDYLALSKIVSAIADNALSGCMLTKIDEAARLGPAMSAIIDVGLPVAYISAGQQVPDDLETVFARQLVHRAVALAGELSIPDDPTALEQAFAV